MKRLLLTFALIFASYVRRRRILPVYQMLSRQGNASSLSGAMDKGGGCSLAQFL